MQHKKVGPSHPQPSFSGKMPKKPKNTDVRKREFLTDDEVEAFMKAAASVGRHRFRRKLPQNVDQS